MTDNGVAGYYSSIDGGVVGYNQGTITNAYNTGEISSLGASSESNNYTGGVVGRNKKNTKIFYLVKGLCDKNNCLWLLNLLGAARGNEVPNG